LSIREIYLIRHGETDYNQSKIVQGEGIDAPLNVTGKQQANAFYQSYRHLTFDKLYTSHLKRAYQTIESFVCPDIPIEQHAGLNEINWGHYEGKPVAQVQSAYYQSLLENWRGGSTHIPIHGGESPEDVAVKQKPVIDLLHASSDKRVLVCMHGRAMRIFLCQLLNKPLYKMDDFSHGNLSLYHIHLQADNSATLVKANCRKHLPINEAPAAHV